MQQIKIDRAMLQQSLIHYQAWNEAELIERIRQAGQKSPIQKWIEFLALMEFGLQIKPEPSKYEQKQKMMMLTKYYQAIEKLEQWREKHG